MTQREEPAAQKFDGQRIESSIKRCTATNSTDRDGSQVYASIIPPSSHGKKLPCTPSSSKLATDSPDEDSTGGHSSRANTRRIMPFVHLLTMEPRIILWQCSVLATTGATRSRMTSPLSLQRMVGMVGDIEDPLPRATASPAVRGSCLMAKHPLETRARHTAGGGR